MVCEISVFCKHSGIVRPCIRNAVFRLETFCNARVRRQTCCKQHKLKTIDNLIQANPYHFCHYVPTRDLNQIINMYVSVEHLSKHTGQPTGLIERVHVSTIPFGPKTESEYLWHEYRKMGYEMSLIAMYRLHLVDEKWRAKFDTYQAHQDMIHRKLEQLNPCSESSR